jgi:hypothetical protein
MSFATHHHTYREGQTAAGLLMLPLALRMLRVESWLLRRLFVDRPLRSLAPFRFRLRSTPAGVRGKHK